MVFRKRKHEDSIMQSLRELEKLSMKVYSENVLGFRRYENKQKFIQILEIQTNW